MDEPYIGPALGQNRKKNLLVGLISLLVLLVVFLAGLKLQAQRNTKEDKQILKADRQMVDGLAGHCSAFPGARGMYEMAMRMHFQNKDLAAKAGLARELENLCRMDLTSVIETRKGLLAAGTANPEDIKALALALLASRQKDAALEVLARRPDDVFCKWLSGWLRSLPPPS